MSGPPLASSTHSGNGSAMSSTDACADAVQRYAQLVGLVHRGELSRDEATDAWTNYVKSVEHSPFGGDARVQDVLRELFSCLLCASPGTSPHSSSHQLLGGGGDEACHSPTMLSSRRVNRLRAQASTSNSPHAPSGDMAAQRHGGSFRNAGASRSRTSPDTPPEAAAAPLPAAPPKVATDALDGGLEPDECRGFELE